MTPYFEDPRAVLLRGDMRAALALLPEESVDSVVTDPPYEISFMGNSWDSRGVAFDPETWRAVLRVLKPGGHLIAFGGSRTYHRIACAIEDAGFEIRDSIAQWIYGSGFPKSLDVSKAIDKAAVAIRAREKCGSLGSAQSFADDAWTQANAGQRVVDDPITAAAWQGWGTALKPAHEPMVLARKPLWKGATVASSVLALGTGAINIGATRVGDDGGGTSCSNRDAEGKCLGHENAGRSTSGETFHAPLRFNPPAGNDGTTPASYAPTNVTGYSGRPAVGRWPANAVFQHAPGCLPVGECEVSRSVGHNVERADTPPTTIGPTGLSARRVQTTTTTTWDCAEGCPVLTLERMHEDAPAFFYAAKPSGRERDHGLGVEFRTRSGGELTGREDGTDGLKSPRAGAGRTGGRKNIHPTVKPIELMRYYCRLVTPPGGLILDCFAGSGSTGVAALHEGFQFLGVERDLDDETGEPLGYCEIIKARLIRALADTAKEIP